MQHVARVLEAYLDGRVLPGRHFQTDVCLELAVGDCDWSRLELPGYLVAASIPLVNVEVLGEVRSQAGCG